jgi:hypothetical protein
VDAGGKGYMDVVENYLLRYQSQTSNEIMGLQPTARYFVLCRARGHIWKLYTYNFPTYDNPTYDQSKFLSKLPQANLNSNYYQNVIQFSDCVH